MESHYVHLQYIHKFIIMYVGGDFGDPKDVVFPPMSTRECINFDITPDDEDEEEEEFQLILTSALQGLQDSTSIVVIRDSKFLYIRN